MQLKSPRNLLIGSLALAACGGQPPQGVGCVNQLNAVDSELGLVACALSNNANREAMWFFVGLHNGTSEAVHLRRVLVLGEDLDAEVVGPTGDTLRLGGTIRLMQRPSSQTDVVLLPGEILGRSLNLGCSREEQERGTCGLFVEPDAPGTYMVTFRFTARCETECPPGAAPWTGELTSASVRVQVEG